MDRIDELFANYSDSGRELIRRAYDIAAEALKDEVRGNGQPFIEHPVGVAKIVAGEIGLPPECVAAIFLHEATRTHEDIDLVRHGFDKSIITMVDGLNKISTIKPKDTRLEAENYKKLIIQYSKDPRVTVLKLADRLEIMRNLNIFPKSSRERKVLETLLLYIPIAHQLGLYNMKREMEDIYLSYAEPEAYRLITNKLRATEKDRVKLMDEFIEPLKKKLSDAGIVYKLKIRTKAAYSIWVKMQKQKVPFEQVYDVFAIRFIIDCDGRPREEELRQCWDVFSYVTEEYEQDTNRLRDWLTKPKTNGYESLHITVKNKESKYVEVQIRSKRMDEIAENGFASHWSYKGIKHEETMDKWLTTVRYALEHPDTNSPEDLPQPPSKEIFVFTPSGELRILPTGATVLDFAFHIHTNIGSHCTGGLVNGKAVPIKEPLTTGDVVEIQTGKNQKPTAGWLNFVVTSKAKTKIRQQLNELENKLAESGREVLNRRLKNWKLEFPDEMMAELMKKLKYSTVNAFLAAIGDESLDVNIVKNYINEQAENAAEAAAELKSNAQAATNAAIAEWKGNSNVNSDDILVINAKDLKGLDYKMAKCCNPVFGDEVFGFVTRADGIKIHRMTCPNAARLLENYSYRIQKVKWAETPSSGSFQVTLKLSANLEGTVINQIMDIVNSFKASIRSFNVNENQRNGTYDIMMKLSVPSNMELDKVISQLRMSKNVLKVNRL